MTGTKRIVLGSLCAATVWIAAAQDPAPPAANPAPAPTAAPAPATPAPATPPEPEVPTISPADERLAQEKYNLASGLFRREQWEVAARVYRSLIDTYPTYERVPDAYFYMAQSHLAAGQNAAARAAYGQLRAAYPDHPLARQGSVNEAILLINSKKYADALALVDTLKPDGDGDQVHEERVLYYRGLCLNELDKTDEALAAFRKLSSRPLVADREFRLYGRLALAYMLRNAADTAGATALFAELAASDLSPPVMREDAQYQVADIHFRATDYAKAAAAFAAFIERFPKSPHLHQARLNLGWSHMLRKDYRAVLEVFKERQEMPPIRENDESLYLQGVSMMQLNLPEPALAKLRKLAADFADSPYRASADAGSVECLYVLQRYPECAALAAELLKATPNHKFAVDLLAYQGRCYVEKEDWPNVIATYELAIAKHWQGWPEKASSLLVLAQAYQALNRTDDVAATYRKLYVISDDVDKPVILLRLAAAELQAGHVEAAQKHYNAIIDDFPESPEAPQALLSASDMLYRDGKMDAAKALLDRFIATFAKNELAPKAYYLRGTVHYHTEKYDLAAADIIEALKSDFTEKAFARLILAYTYWKQEKEPEALAEFSVLLETPDVFNQIDAEFMGVLGSRFLERNQVNAAERIFSILAKSEDPAARFQGEMGLGRVSLLRGALDGAVARFLAARKFTDKDPPNRSRVLALLGEVYRQQEKHNQAIIAFDEAIRLGAPDARTGALANYGMAEMLFAKKEMEKAEEHATSAYILYDDPVYSARAMLLEIRLALTLKRPRDARLTLDALTKKYPVHIAAFRNDPANADLFKQLDPK